MPLPRSGGAEQIDRREVADDPQVHRAAVVVGRVVPAAGERERLGVGVHHRGVHGEVPGLELLPLRVREALAVLPLAGRVHAAEHLEVARLVGPARELRRLLDAAALLVEALHVEREGVADPLAADAKVHAAADACDPQEVAPLRRGGNVHLARLLAAEGRPLAHGVVAAAHDGARQLHLARLGVDEIERLRPVRRRGPRAERPEPAAEVGVALRGERRVADLVHLEERRRHGGVVGKVERLAGRRRHRRLRAGLHRILEREEDRPEDLRVARGLLEALVVRKAQEAVRGLPERVRGDLAPRDLERTGAQRGLEVRAPGRRAVGGGVEGVVELPAGLGAVLVGQGERGALVVRAVALDREVQRVERRDAPLRGRGGGREQRRGEEGGREVRFHGVLSSSVGVEA